jgi:predicted nucleic acid-binding protein
MPIVIDASITVAWCYEDAATPLSEVVLQHVRTDRAIVPAVWPLKVANAILTGERRGRLSDANTERFLSLLQAMSITVDEETSVQAWTSILALARRFALSSYHSAYLELALRRGVAIATTDRQIVAAARDLGVLLIESP